MTPRLPASPAGTAGVVAIIVAAACFGLLAGACGGAGSSSNGVATLPSPSAPASTPTSPTATLVGSDEVAQAIAYAQCLRSNGVPMWPDPDASGGFPKSQLEHLGVTDSQLQAAQTACQELLPIAGRGPSQSQLQQGTAQALRFARCMRDNGVAGFPDPDATGRIPDPATVGLDQGAARFQAANDACGADRPGYFPSNAEYFSWAATHGSAVPGSTNRP